MSTGDHLMGLGGLIEMMLIWGGILVFAALAFVFTEVCWPLLKPALEARTKRLAKRLEGDEGDE